MGKLVQRRAAIVLSGVTLCLLRLDACANRVHTRTLGITPRLRIISQFQSALRLGQVPARGGQLRWRITRRIGSFRCAQLGTRVSHFLAGHRCTSSQHQDHTNHQHI